jgi:hypothetical protein
LSQPIKSVTGTNSREDDGRGKPYFTAAVFPHTGSAEQEKDVGIRCSHANNSLVKCSLAVPTPRPEYDRLVARFKNAAPSVFT